MATVTLYKNPRYTGTVLTEAGAPFPDGGLPGIAAPLDDYYDGLVKSGKLLTDQRSSGNDTTAKTGTLSTVALDGTNDYRLIVADVVTREETVYAEGAFHAPYATNSTLNTGTGAYSVKRDGGWPTGSSVAVAKKFTASPPPTGAQTWGLIYAVDFRTLATQSMTTVASYTVDGLTWYSCGGTGAQTAGVVNGAGLQIDSPAGSGSGFPVGNIGYKHLKLPLSQIPGIDINAPMTIFARVPVTYGAGHDPFGWITLIDGVSDTSSVTGTQRQTGVAAGLYGYTSETIGTLARAAIGDNTVAAASLAGAPVLNSDDCMGIIAPTRRNTDALFAPYTGAAPDAANAYNQIDNVPLAASPRTNPCLVYTFNAQNGADNTFNMTHLWIFQPKVVP